MSDDIDIFNLPKDQVGKIGKIATVGIYEEIIEAIRALEITCKWILAGSFISIFKITTSFSDINDTFSVVSIKCFLGFQILSIGFGFKHLYNIELDKAAQKSVQKLTPMLKELASKHADDLLKKHGKEALKKAYDKNSVDSTSRKKELNERLKTYNFFIGQVLSFIASYGIFVVGIFFIPNHI